MIELFFSFLLALAPASALGNSVVPIAVDSKQDLLLDFERLLSKGDFAKLAGVLEKMDAAGIGKKNPGLLFIRGLCAFDKGKERDARVFFKSYIASGDKAHLAEARDFLFKLQHDKSGQLTNSIGMKLVKIPTGSFYMGSKNHYSQIQKDFNEVFESTPHAFSDEFPRHLVNITNQFYAGKFEVTISQFEKFTDETGYRTDAERNGGSLSGFDPNAGSKIEAAEWVHKNWRSGRPDDPVSFISWKDANEFVVWLGKKENKRYRLPTEAEWEYFARAGTTTYFSSGQSSNSLVGFANVPDLKFKADIKEVRYDVIPFNDGYTGKAPVGQFAPNPFGLHDIHGNVFEWCYDGYSSNGYSHHNKTNPYIKPDSASRVIRGGCYM